jgi:MFS family permease
MADYSISINTPKRLHRWAVAILFFLPGLCFSSWGSRIPSIQQHLGLSEAALGAVLFSLPVGLMISLPLSGWLVSKVGSRNVALPSLIAYAVILVSLGTAQSTFQLVAALFLFGLVANILNIAVNTQAVKVEEMYQRPIMASFHGIWSMAAFTGAAIGTTMIGTGVVPFKHFLLILVLTIIGVAACAKYVVREEETAKEEKKPIFVMPDKALLNLGIIAFCSLICEGAMFDWSGVYFSKVVQAKNAWVGAGYTAFMSTMAGGRFIADHLTDRLGLKRMLQISGALTATGLIISVILPHLVTAIIGFLFVGVGVSSVVPLVYSVAGKSKTMAPSAALAAVSTIGFAGFLLGPPLIGLVAEATNLRISFSIIAVMGMCVSLVASRSKSL